MSNLPMFYMLTFYNKSDPDSFRVGFASADSPDALEQQLREAFPGASAVQVAPMPGIAMDNLGMNTAFTLQGYYLTPKPEEPSETN